MTLSATEIENWKPFWIAQNIKFVLCHQMLNMLTIKNCKITLDLQVMQVVLKHDSKQSYLSYGPALCTKWFLKKWIKVNVNRFLRKRGFFCKLNNTIIYMQIDISLIPGSPLYKECRSLYPTNKERGGRFFLIDWTKLSMPCRKKMYI